MAALSVIALDTTTPQLRAPASGDTYAAPRALAMTPETLTGSSATSSLSIAQTWNTTGTPTAIDLNVTDTASNASSLLMNLRVGGSSLFSVNKAGRTQTGMVGSSVTSNFSGILFSSIVHTHYASSAIAAELRQNQWTVGGALGSGATLSADAANTLAQRNGVNAQAFNIYNTYTDASNYERGFTKWVANVLQIGTEAAGTGTGRDVHLVRGGLEFFRLNSSFEVFFAANRRLRLSGGSWIDIAENGSVVTAPAANSVRIFAEDNGSGKTRLMALFATGAAQQIAIEP